MRLEERASLAVSRHGNTVFPPTAGVKMVPMMACTQDPGTPQEPLQRPARRQHRLGHQEHARQVMPITLFQSTQPGIRIGLDERMNPDIVRGVRDGNADLGALWNLIDLTGLYVLPYRSNRSSGCGQRDRTPARHVRASLERR